MQFERGYKSPYFVTDNTTMKAVLNDPMILLVDGVINSAAELVPVLQKASGENKSLVIVAEEFGEEALAVLLINKSRGVIKACAVKAPDYGDRRTLLLEDMATLTGGQVVSVKKQGIKLEKVVGPMLEQCLGNARMITITKESTTIVDGKGSSEALEARAEELKIKLTMLNQCLKRKLQERLAKLSGGVAIISVGGNSDLEIKEKRPC